MSTPVAPARLAAWAGSLVRTRSRGDARVGEATYRWLIAVAVTLAIVVLHPPVLATDDPIVFGQAQDPAALGWGYFVYPNYVSLVMRLVALVEAPNPFLIGAIAVYVTTCVVALFLAWRVHPLAPLALLAPLDYGTLSNVQWPLGAYLIGMLVASPPTSPRGRIGDLVGLLLAGLSGPVSVVALPLYLIRARGRPWRWHAAVLGCVALVQLMTMASFERYQAPAHDIAAVLVARMAIPVALLLIAGLWRRREALGALYVALAVSVLGIMATLHTTAALIHGDGARYFYLPWAMAIGLAVIGPVAELLRHAVHPDHARGDVAGAEGEAQGVDGGR